MTDLTTLMYDSLRGFRAWALKEIYLGPNSNTNGRIVPLVDDLIIDWETGFYRVVDLNTDTYVPTLMNVDIGELSRRQIGIGLASQLPIPQPSPLELAYLNSDVTPFTLSIDCNYRIYGSEAAFLKLFFGTDLTNAIGQVISQVYNGSGNYVSQNIELELVDPLNTAIKRPPVFNVDRAMQNGEIVTAVIYTQAGGITGQHSFLIMNTNAIRGLGDNSVYITDIILVSPLLDNVQQDLINVPANVPITASSFKARLLYSNGDSSIISVGTTKCKLHGINSFNTSLAGVNGKVVLTYYPSVNEAAVNLSNPTNKSITHTYRIHTVNNIPDYSFKIYVIPIYNSVSHIFTNKYYLTSLNYDLLMELNSSQINVNLAGGGIINNTPTAPSQTLVLSVIISDLISDAYAGYTFTQQITINYGAINNIPWVLDYLNTGENVYGVDAYFEYSNIGQRALRIQGPAVSIEQWYGIFWEPIHAVYDESIRLSPPLPTHFRLKFQDILSPIRLIDDYWNINLPNDFDIDWISFGTVEIIWLLPTSDVSVYQYLGVTPVILKNTLT